MRVGRDTRKRIEAIKEEMDEPLRTLAMHIARMKEHAGTKRITAPLENAVEKIERWKNTAHFYPAKYRKARRQKMSEFRPVETVEDLNNLDSDEVFEGYRAGLQCAPEPGSDRSRSYWHGWRNGSTDSGQRQKDASQSRLAEAVCRPARRMGMN